MAIPVALVALLREHLELYCASAEDALVFSLESGLPVRRSSFNKLTAWKKSTAKIGVPDLHFHDLRHTGNMLAAASKVTTKDLMARMGHDSMQAAIIYQHASREADRSIAAHLNTPAQATRVGREEDQEEGCQGNQVKGCPGDRGQASG